jgi:3-hydroxyisobutyrate dehydrogenase
MSDVLTMRIGWIGTGVMGAPMAGHVLEAGHQMSVHTRTKEKAAALLERGASWAANPAEAADGADLVFSIVGYPQDVEAVHLGTEGTLAARRLPRVIVDMSTSRPGLAIRIARAAKARGMGSIDAPVSGGPSGARERRLSIMIGGAERDVALARPVLELMGRSLVHHGGPGAGQHAKAINQTLVAANLIGVCEGLLYAKKAGLDPVRVIESVGSGVADSSAVRNFGPRMVKRDFEPRFYADYFLKDLSIAMEESARMGLVMPGLALARQLYEEVKAQGHGRKGIQALLLALEKLNGMDSPDGETRK